MLSTSPGIAVEVGFVALIGVTLLSLAVGDGLVRASAALHFANWMLVALLQRRHEHVFQSADFLVDLAGAALACWIAVAARQHWAACLAACQVLGVVNYPVQLLDRSVLDQASVVASYVWVRWSPSFGQFGGLAKVDSGLSHAASSMSC